MSQCDVLHEEIICLKDVSFSVLERTGNKINSCYKDNFWNNDQ